MTSLKNDIRIIWLFPILLTVIISVLYSVSHTQDEEQIRKKERRIHFLIYEEKNFDAALILCREIIAVEDPEDIPSDIKYDVERYIHLIENYSDYDQKPLSLFFETERIKRMWRRGHGHTKKFKLEEGNLYRDILKTYPLCKLAGYVQYLLAKHYKGNIGNNLSYLDNEKARQEAIGAYQEIIEKYPDSLFPLDEYYERKDSKITLYAQLNIGWLYESSSHVEPKIDEAINAYYKTIDMFSNELENAETRKLILGVYVSLLRIYSGETVRGKYIDMSKVKEICSVLLNDFPNQQYEEKGFLFGETHPVAYMTLAKLENDKNKAIGYCQRIVENYPESTGGQLNTCAIGRYSFEALEQIIYLLNDTQLAIRKYEEIINSVSDKPLRVYSQYKIAEMYETKLNDLHRAKIEYKKVLEYFDDNNFYEEEGPTFGGNAKRAIERIEEKLKGE